MNRLLTHILMQRTTSAVSRRALRNGLTLTLISALMLSSLATQGFAAPRSEAVARAAAIKRQVDALDIKTEILAEEYNAAQERHVGLSVQRRAASLRLKQTTAKTSRVQARLSARARSMYRQGPIGYTEVLLGAKDFESFARTWELLRELNESDAHLTAELKSAKAEQMDAERQLKVKVDQAAAVSRQLASRKRAILSELSTRKKLLAGVEAEVAALDRAEERRRTLAASRAASTKRVSRSDKRFPPPTRAARSEVVAIARQYLGARYVWGATGPNTFDCSGFTQYVYRQVGVNLPRVSRSQINAGQRVNRSDLQPGDLVFFGSPIHHVGMYVGGGMMIHAPRSGDVVKISPLHNNYVGATRP